MRATRIICGCLVVFAAQAEAGRNADKCKSAAESSDKQCQAAADAYKASDAARSNAGGAASGKNINPNAGISSATTSGLSGDASSAISQCQAAKKQCESQCDSAMQGAQQDAQSQDKSIKQQGIQDMSEIPGIKSGKCQNPIDQKTQQLQQAKDANDKATKEANDTKKESDKGGGAPQMSPPQSGDKSSDNGTSSGNTAQASLNCAVSGGSRFSDCNSTFTAKCTSSMTASECDTFTDRYCNMTSASSASSTPVATATTNLVIDQKGEGVGSNYCAYASSYRFCQTSGREQCASCQRIYVQQTCTDPTQCLAQSSDSEQAKQKAACPDDPIYVTGGWTLSGAASSGSGTSSSTSGTYSGSTLLSTSGSASQTQINTTVTGTTSSATTSLIPASATSGATGASGATGGGSFGSATGASGETPSSGSSNREGLPNGIIPASTSAMDGGGGSGGGNEPSWINESERAPAADIRQAFEGRKPDSARPMAGMPADVSNSLGPSIFTIGSGGIHSFCLKQQLVTCGH